MKQYCYKCNKEEETYETSKDFYIYIDNKKITIDRKVERCCNCNSIVRWLK